jgi:hypothetical protein
MTNLFCMVIKPLEAVEYFKGRILGEAIVISKSDAVQKMKSYVAK